MIKIYKKEDDIILFGHYYSNLLFFLFLFPILFFHIKFYKHQYFSISVIIIMELGYYLLQYKYFIEKTLYFSLFQIIVSSLESLFNIYIKGLMEFKYFSPYRVMNTFGLIILFLLLIIYFIVSYKLCNNYLCNLDYENKKYIDNIYSIFEQLNT